MGSLLDTFKSDFINRTNFALDTSTGLNVSKYGIDKPITPDDVVIDYDNGKFGETITTSKAPEQWEQSILDKGMGKTLDQMATRPMQNMSSEEKQPAMQEQQAYAGQAASTGAVNVNAALPKWDTTALKTKGVDVINSGIGAVISGRRKNLLGM